MKPFAANPSSSAVILEGTGSVFQLPELVADADSRPLCTSSSKFIPRATKRRYVLTLKPSKTTLLALA